MKGGLVVILGCTDSSLVTQAGKDDRFLVQALDTDPAKVTKARGVIQQVADPITLYDQPTNRFVAGFIGTPPMNFFRGRIENQNGNTIFVSDFGFTLPAPAGAADALKNYAGKSITLGIRPEDIGSLTDTEASII